ncbi:ATP-dependent DNA helicase II subunit 2 [Yarrowia sp. C11]|nr:ATP-dependent DNA helicase II subunit 2 [Yarrowia sp. C11]
MASKEATVYVVDLHDSMSLNNARGEDSKEMTDLNWGLQYIYSEISNKILSGRKTDVVGLVGVHTDTTQNMFESEPGFEHIDIISPIQHFNLDVLLEAKKQLVPNSDNKGDLISAIVVAIQMIKLYTKALKYKRNIVILTNGRGNMDLEDSQGIVKQINENGIVVKIMGIDFDDEEAEVIEEDKPEEKRDNEQRLKDFAELCEDSVFATYKEARDSLDIPKIKSVNPVRAFQGDLVLSDPEQQSHQRVMSIGIEVFPCTRRATAMTASSYAMNKLEPAGAPSSTPNANNLQAVKWDRQYYVDDETEIGGKKELERDILENGYRYGSEIVYITKEEEDAIMFSTTASLQLIGFVNKSTVPPYMLMGHTDFIIGQRGNNRDAVAISAFARALFEVDNFALARYVSKDGKDPQLVVLMPYIKAELEALVFCQLPFAEDERHFLLPSLTSLETRSGDKTVTTHSRLLPTKEMLSAMDDYVDAMDLSKLNDEDGEPWLTMEDCFNPSIHHIKNVVKECAVSQDYDKIPEPLPILTRFSKPAEELTEEAKPQLELLKHLFEIKEQFKEAKKRKTEVTVGRTDLDLDALLNGEPEIKSESSQTPSVSVKIESSSQAAPPSSQNTQQPSLDPENISPELVRALNKLDTKANSDEEFKAGATILYQQTITLLEQKIESSKGNDAYNEVVGVLLTMHEQADEMEIPDVFNAAKDQLVKKLESGDLGGDRNVLVAQIDSL